MEVLRYFMRWEDKYWGLYLVSLLFLWIYAKHQKESKKVIFQVVSIYGAVSYLVFVCPFTYQLFASVKGSLGIEPSLYYIFSHIWLLPVILPFTFSIVLDFLRQGETQRGKERIYFILGCLCILCAIGKLAYVNMDEKKAVMNIYTADEVAAYELVLADAKALGFEQDMTIWGPHEWMSKSRIYDTRLIPIYGKDIVSESAAYDPNLRVLYVGYTGYEDQDSLLINKEQQLSAIAYFMDAFTVAPCRYVAVFDPKAQGLALDAKEIFEKYGYVMVGQAGDMQVYRFLAK